MLRVATFLTGLCLACQAVAAPGYLETWDLVAGPNGWYYFENSNQVGIPLPWRSSGGQQIAFVESPLDSLRTWAPTPGQNYYPAYTYGRGPPDGRIYHPINLHTDPRIEVYLKDTSTAGIGLANLHGGRVCLWVGQWDEPPGGPANYAFYYLDEPLNFAKGWTYNNISVDPGATWLLLGSGGSAPALNDILVSPQQWGFGIFGGTGAPSGTLGFDTFNNTVPEPNGLLVLGLLAALRRRMRTNSHGRIHEKPHHRVEPAGGGGMHAGAGG